MMRNQVWEVQFKGREEPGYFLTMEDDQNTVESMIKLIYGDTIVSVAYKSQGLFLNEESLAEDLKKSHLRIIK